MDIIIYGAGKWGSKAFKSYTSRGANILFFMDADTQKQNGTLCGRKIYSPSKAKQYRNTQIVIAVKSDMGIREYLEELGCTNLVKYVPYFDYDETIVHAYENQPAVYWSETHEVLEFDKPYSCTSQICNQSFFDMPFFQYWSKHLMPNLIDHLKATNQFSPKAFALWGFLSSDWTMCGMTLTVLLSMSGETKSRIWPRWNNMKGILILPIFTISIRMYRNSRTRN